METNSDATEILMRMTCVIVKAVSISILPEVVDNIFIYKWGQSTIKGKGLSA